MFDPPSKFLLLLLFPAGPPFSSSSLSWLLLSLLLLLLLLLFALASGAKKFVLRNLVPHALHKHGLLAGPRLHCGESNAPQWSHGPPGLHPGGNSLVVPPGPATATLFAGPPLALSSPPLFAFSFFSFCEADVALLLASFFLFFAFGDAELFVSPPPFAVIKVSFVVLGLALPSFALSVPSEFCVVVVVVVVVVAVALLLLFGPSRDGPFRVNLFSSSCSATSLRALLLVVRPTTPEPYVVCKKLPLPL
jgi:hypothetical protein